MIVETHPLVNHDEVADLKVISFRIGSRGSRSRVVEDWGRSKRKRCKCAPSLL